MNHNIGPIFGRRIPHLHKLIGVDNLDSAQGVNVVNFSARTFVQQQIFYVSEAI